MVVVVMEPGSECPSVAMVRWNRSILPLVCGRGGVRAALT
jgi:hypothetical protein